MRRPRPRVLAAVAALCVVAVALGAGSATAQSGPGVVLKRDVAGAERRVFGAQIGGGLSIRGLLRKAGVDPSLVDSVTVAGDDGNSIPLRGSELDGAFVSDQGGVTRFFRPGRPDDDVRSSGGQPLEMSVNGSSFLSIEMKADPTNAKLDQEVRFQARLRVTPPGARLVYTWNFGEAGAPTPSGEGLTQVSHRYATAGDKLVTVQIEGSAGSTPQCSPSCSGQGSIVVQVEGRQERRPEQTQGIPQGTGTGLGGTGTGGTGTGTGTGDGGGSEDGAGGVATTAPARPARKPPTPRVQRPESRSSFSTDPESGAGKAVVEGVLLADRGRNLKGGLPKANSGGSPNSAKGTPATVGDPFSLGGSLMLALAIVSIGALRERRRVRLRLA